MVKVDGNFYEANSVNDDDDDAVAVDDDDGGGGKRLQHT
jgi:hypothetical protein